MRSAHRNVSGAAPAAVSFALLALLVGDRALAAPRPRRAPPPQAITDDERRAQVFLDKGLAAYEAGDFETARVAFERTVEIVPTKPNPHRWLGLTNAKLGRCAEAIESLDRFLSLVTSQDPRTVEATVIRDRCVAELAPKVGSLAVTTAPAGAEVRLDDPRSKVLGTTPWRATDVEIGAHVLYLRKRGFEELSRAVEITRDQTLQLDIDLRAVAPPAAALAPAPARSTTKYWVGGGAVVVVAAVVGTVLLVGMQSEDGPRTLPPVVTP